MRRKYLPFFHCHGVDMAPEGTQFKMRRTHIMIGLLLAPGLPFCHLGDLGKNYSGLGPLFGSEMLWWVLFAAIVLYVLFAEHKSLSSVGFRKPVSSPGLESLSSGLATGESPRWHEDRLWFSDWCSQEIVAVVMATDQKHLPKR